jgi:hypothetical protein
MMNGLVSRFHKLTMYETDIGGLVELQNVRDGFRSLDAIRGVATWLHRQGLLSQEYTLLAGRFDLIQRHPETLRLALECGRESGASGLDRIAGALIGCLLSRGEGDEALAVIRECSAQIPDVDLAHLLIRAAEKSSNGRAAAEACLDAARIHEDAAEFAEALRCISLAKKHAMAVDDGHLVGIVAEAQERVREQMELVRGLVQETDWNRRLESARASLKGKRVAVVSGFDLSFMNEVGRALGCEMELFRAALPHRIEDNDRLVEGVKAGRYAVVVSVAPVGHIAALRDACRKADVPSPHCSSAGEESLTRQIVHAAEFLSGAPLRAARRTSPTRGTQSRRKRK